MFLTDPLRACSPNQSPLDSVDRNTGSSLADFCWVTLTCGPKQPQFIINDLFYHPEEKPRKALYSPAPH